MPVEKSPSGLLGRALKLAQFRCLVLVLLGFMAPLAVRAQITSGTRLPSNDEQYTVQLINQARTSTNGLAILQRIVTNDLSKITASTTINNKSGTPWSANFWTSSIPNVAFAMNYFNVHPGDLKKQFTDLVIPNYPLAWHSNLGNVASGYNSIIIANAGVGPGFPHALAPYQDQSTFAAYAQRYTDGGYGPLTDIQSLAENVAPDNYSDPLQRFCAFMIDWGSTADGIQDQTSSSHRLNIMSATLTETGLSSKPGWDAGDVTEDEEFGARFSTHVRLTGVVYTDLDKNGFYTSGEGVSGATISATPVGGGATTTTTSYASGGYVLELDTPGTYRVAVASSYGTTNAGNVTIGSKNVLLNVAITPPPDFNGDGKTDYLLFNPTTRATAIWHLNGAQVLSKVSAPPLPATWTLVAEGDFNQDGRLDYVAYQPSTRKTEIWYMKDTSHTGSAAGPVLTAGWTIAAVADFNGDGKPDYLLFNASTLQTKIWYLNGATFVSESAGPTLPAGWTVAAAADFNQDGSPDYLLYNPTTRQTAIWTMNNNVFVKALAGKTVVAGYTLLGAGDFNSDGHPDYVLFSPTLLRTALWHFNVNTYLSSAYGPALPAGWTVIAR